MRDRVKSGIICNKCTSDRWGTKSKYNVYQCRVCGNENNYVPPKTNKVWWDIWGNKENDISVVTINQDNKVITEEQARRLR